jgi:hypothetical protein
LVRIEARYSGVAAVGINLEVGQWCSATTLARYRLSIWSHPSLTFPYVNPLVFGVSANDIYRGKKLR